MKGVIFFDISNVLVGFNHEKMYIQISKITGLSINQIKDFFIEQNYQHRYEVGDVTESTIFSELLKRSKLNFTKKDLIKAGTNIFKENKEMLGLVYKLKKIGHKLILLSNTCFAHFNYQLKFFPIIQLFEEKILSFEKKIRKPDPEIFQLALKMTKGKKSFYTDDTAEYIQAAKTVGLDGDVFKSYSKLYSKLKEKKFVN